MADVSFRDAISGVIDTVYMYPDYTINQVIEGSIRRFSIKFPKNAYAFMIGSRQVDPSQPIRSIRPPSEAPIDVVAALGHVSGLQAAAKTVSVSQRPLILLGNGISDDPTGGHNSLSTKTVHYDFLKDFALTSPRHFSSRKEEIRKLMESLDRREGDLNMLAFMQILSGMDDVRDRFLQHLVRACCSAEPHIGHETFLDFLEVLRTTRPRLRVFTTNYDNLVEKAYLKDYPEMTKIGHSHLYQLSMRHPGAERAPPHETPNYPVQYVVPGEQASPRSIPIAPIHGSVRVAKCSECGHSLQTEAAPLGVGICVYCGHDVDSLVLPSAEGKTSVEALEYFEKCIRAADLLVFVGFGFNDPHIVDRLSHFRDPSTPIVNLCREPLPDSLGGAGHSSLDVQADVTVGLSYIASLVNPATWWDLKHLRRLASGEREEELG